MNNRTFGMNMVATCRQMSYASATSFAFEVAVPRSSPVDKPYRLDMLMAFRAFGSRSEDLIRSTDCWRKELTVALAMRAAFEAGGEAEQVTLSRQR